MSDLSGKKSDGRDERFARGPEWLPDPDEISDREAMAHATGYAQALEDCKDAEPAALIKERNQLMVDIAFIRARLRIAERDLEEIRVAKAIAPADRTQCQCPKCGRVHWKLAAPPTGMIP